MQKINVTAPVMLALFNQVLYRCRSILNADPDNKALPHSKGPSLYGYRTFKHSKNSIRGVLLNNKKVLEAIVENDPGTLSLQEDKLDKIRERYSGKYLYNRILEINKKGFRTVQLSGIYAAVYFVFLGYKNIEDFLVNDEHHGLDQAEIERQMTLLKMFDEEISSYAIPFIAFYFSYRENRIKQFVIEIDPINNNKIRQTGFHFASVDQPTDHDTDYRHIEQSKVYTGKGINLDNVLQITLEGRSVKGKANAVSIYLYKGGMEISNMNLIRGTLTTISSHGYIFTGEIFLRRVTKKERTKGLGRQVDVSDMLKSDFYTSDLEVTKIKRYLHLQRRTLRIPRNTEQNIDKLSAKRYSLNALDGLIGQWRIWGLDNRNRIVQSVMSVSREYSAFVNIFNGVEREKQVCIFRLSGKGEKQKVWISAHEEYGVELQNIALIEVPAKQSDRRKIITGESIGLGRLYLASTPLVFIPEDQHQNNSIFPKRLEINELTTLIIHSKEDSLYHKAHQYLKDRITHKSGEKGVKKFPTMKQLLKHYNNALGSTHE